MRYKAEIFHRVDGKEVVESVFARNAASDAEAKQWFDRLVNDLPTAEYRSEHARLFKSDRKIAERQFTV